MNGHVVIFISSWWAEMVGKTLHEARAGIAKNVIMAISRLVGITLVRQAMPVRSSETLNLPGGPHQHV